MKPLTKRCECCHFFVGHPRIHQVPGVGDEAETRGAMMKRNLFIRCGKLNKSLRSVLALLVGFLLLSVAPQLKVGAQRSNAPQPNFVINDSGAVGSSTINIAG